LLVAALCFSTAHGLPRGGLDAPPAGELLELSVTQRGGNITLQQAVQMATEHRPGRVVRAVTVENGGRRVHEIRILLEEGGRVVTVRIDAQTGESR
jgi:uncharacterized iron-regulated membrane protein